MKKNQNIVGRRIRQLRLGLGFSQEKLTVKLQMAGWDISRAGLSKIESELRRVNDAELYVLAGVLDCTMDDLVANDYRKSEKLVRSALRQGKSDS